MRGFKTKEQQQRDRQKKKRLWGYIILILPLYFFIGSIGVLITHDYRKIEASVYDDSDYGKHGIAFVQNRITGNKIPLLRMNNSGNVYSDRIERFFDSQGTMELYHIGDETLTHELILAEAKIVATDCIMWGVIYLIISVFAIGLIYHKMIRIKS